MGYYLSSLRWLQRKKRVTKGLPMSEYPTLSQLTRVQLALEPTA